MSEPSESATARRNLLIIISLILAIELTGATINAINAPGVTIDIKRPELLIYFLYAVLIYSVFRFWHLAKGTHLKHSQISNKYINRSKYVTAIANNSLSPDEGFYLNDGNPSIVRGIFTRQLVVSGHKDGKGITNGPIQLSYFRLLLPEIAADCRAIFEHKDFVEYTFPFVYLNTLITVKIALVLRSLLYTTQPG